MSHTLGLDGEFCVVKAGTRDEAGEILAAAVLRSPITDQLQVVSAGISVAEVSGDEFAPGALEAIDSWTGRWVLGPAR